MYRKRNRKAFTIVELVIVIAVIAILATVLVPTFGNMIEKAQDSKAMQAAKNAYTSHMINHDADGTNTEYMIYEVDGRFVALHNGAAVSVYDTQAEALQVLFNRTDTDENESLSFFVLATETDGLFYCLSDAMDDDDAISIHVSFDDVTDVVNTLAAGSLDSAFDHTFLAMLKDAHEKYGLVFSLYLQSAPTSVSTKYQNELSQASSWLKWGLHSLNGGNYANSTYEQGKRDWNKMVDVVLKLTGTSDAIDRLPRLHQFYSSEAAMLGMRDASYGALGFLSTDDTRSAYYLPQDQLDFLYGVENDHITDFENNLIFYRTDLRLDWFTNAGFSECIDKTKNSHLPVDAGDIKSELELRYEEALYKNTWDCYTIFTHEWQSHNAIKNALVAIGEFAKEHGVKFDYPQNCNARLTSHDIYPDTASDVESDASPTPATITSNNISFTVVNDPTDLVYIADIGCGSARGKGCFSNYVSVKGRATAQYHILKVSGGQTVKLHQVISEETLYWSMIALDSNGATVAESPSEMVCASWISKDVILPDGTEYIIIIFKRGDGSTSFSEDELKLLPNAISIE